MTIVCQDGELGQGCEGHHEHGIPFIWDLYAMKINPKIEKIPQSNLDSLKVLAEAWSIDKDARLNFWSLAMTLSLVYIWELLFLGHWGLVTIYTYKIYIIYMFKVEKELDQNTWIPIQVFK